MWGWISRRSEGGLQLLRPKAIVWFERLYLASTGITIAAVLANYEALREQAIESAEGRQQGQFLG
jgi:hypothetical protein